MIFGHISRKTISLSFISGCFFLPSNLGYPIFLLLQESFASRFGGINPTAAVSVGSVLMDAFFALLIGMYAVVPKYVSSYLGIGESTKAEQNANRVF